MADFKGFSASSVKRTAKTKKSSEEWQGMPPLDLDIRIEMWQAGLLHLRLPIDMKPRSLTSIERQWLDRAALAEYIAPEENGQRAIFYTSEPPDFKLENADWYLHPDDYWSHPPVRLEEMVATFPANLFQLSESGQAPGFYPDRTPDYTNEQETVMRSIFRETVRIGWSLPQYKWFVMKQFRKTTAQINRLEALQVFAQLQAMENELEAR